MISYYKKYLKYKKKYQKRIVSDFNNLLDKEKPDVFCMGETKLSKDYDMKDNILDNFKLV